MNPRIEVCVEDLAGARAATAAGAHRLELCSTLGLGGLTPQAGFVEAVVQEGLAESVALLRPRPGDFVYDQSELTLIESAIDTLKLAGVGGFALGVLTSDHRIDREATRGLIDRARPLPITFHRAFDFVSDPLAALDILSELGIERLLTSGGAPTASQGASQISTCVQHAGTHIEIIAAGGVRAENARAIADATGAPWLHLSASRHETVATDDRLTGGQPYDPTRRRFTDPDEIRRVLQSGV